MGRTKTERTLSWSVQAQTDVAAIIDFYNERNGNSVYSRQLTTEFQAKMDRVVANPYSGEVMKKGIRFVVAMPYQLFYRVTKTEIIVVAVWDGRRDPKTLELIR